MELFSLKNSYLSLSVSALGAEIQSIRRVNDGREYMWQGDERFWNRRAPILFPFVGRLKKDEYSFEGINYTLGQHGFARNEYFEITKNTPSALEFTLKSTPKSRAIYPFDFELHVSYELIDWRIITRYHVINTSAKMMLFSIGGHPAFALHKEDGEFTNYSLVADAFFPENRELLDGGLRKGEFQRLHSTGISLPLTYTLFEHDAIVIDRPKFNELALVHRCYGELLRFYAKGYSHFGIWTKPEAPFLCLEPWHGIADKASDFGELTQKEGLITLEPQATFSSEYSVEFNAHYPRK